LDEPLFCPFPEQEVLVLGNFPIDEIWGDIDPRNILAHSRRGVECYNAEVESKSLTYKQVINSSDKAKWIEAVNKEVATWKITKFGTSSTSILKINHWTALGSSK
jgi:hypothetical protein